MGCYRTLICGRPLFLTEPREACASLIGTTQQVYSSRAQLSAAVGHFSLILPRANPSKSIDQLEACCGTLEPIRAVSKARLAGKTEKRQTLTCSTFVCWRNASFLESVISRSCRTFPPAPVQRTARSRPHDQLLLSKLFKIIFCRFRQTLSNEPVITEVGITQSQIILTARLRKGS